MSMRGSVRTKWVLSWNEVKVGMKLNRQLISISKKLDRINNKLNYIIIGVDTNSIQNEQMSIELDNLTAQVKANSDLLDSATVLINGIADRITAAGVDPAKLSALSAELKAKDDVLAAAVAANTPTPPVV